MVSYFLPDVRPRCVITPIPGMRLEKGRSIGFMYLICRRSNHGGNNMGTPGTSLG